MVRRMLKWIGIGLGTLVVLLVTAGLLLTIRANRMANEEYALDTINLSIPVDKASQAEGERLLAIRACGNCHGDDLAGGLFAEDALFGTYYAANLTGGKNSATVNYTPADWDRAIRHGLGQDHKALWAMPSTEYATITDADLALMIAYLDSLPPADQPEPYPEPGPGLLARLLAGSKLLPLLPATVIDHDVRPPASIPAEVSLEYGEYLATVCTGCHGQDLAGGDSFGAEKQAPANLTPAGNLANWTEQDFIIALRTGVTPEGKTLDPDVMPWPMTSRMTEVELAAIWLYLSSLPPVEP